MPRRDMYTTADVAQRLGVSTAYIRRQIDKGRLISHGGGHRHLLWRDHVYRWLIAERWDHDQIRGLFPMPGPLACVGVRSHLASALVHERPRMYKTLFAMAMSLHETMPWGVVFDVNGGHLTAGHARSELSTYSTRADRPLLIALHGDDGAGMGVFDVMIPDRLPAGKIAQRIRAVRPWGK